MRCEVYSGKVSAKGRRILDAMAAAGKKAGISVQRSATYVGSSDIYMVWGLGHPERRKWTEAHKAAGGRVVGWDLGYWDRARRFRLTIDDDHPHRLVRDMPSDRLPAIKLREDADPAGPVVVVGMGPKSVNVYPGAASWESRTVAALRALYPSRHILLRPKYQKTPIEDVLRGASLVVCRHSNVALDACIAGIPVVCEDGIAHSLYGSDLAKPTHATPAQRRQLLANAAYWQWAPSEAREAWEFIKCFL